MLCLPIEIVHHITDQHESNKDFLKLCSLISRCWVNRARFHLFHTVRLRNDFYAFLKVCSNASSTIPLHVHCLCIDHANCNALVSTISPLHCSLLNDILTWRSTNGSSISELLPRLTELRLDWIGWWKVSSKAKLTLTTRFRFVKRLKLGDVVFDSEYEFREVLCSFPMLEEAYLVSLKLRHSTQGTASRWPAAQGHRIPSENSLKNWLHSRPVPPTLRKICIQINSDDSPRFMAMIIPCSSLEVLEFKALRFCDSMTFGSADAIAKLLDSAGPGFKELRLFIRDLQIYPFSAG
ncbi:MAG: hypothetical protein NXY57DRAFT_356636, partial [Lentinula lateritia]